MNATPLDLNFTSCNTKLNVTFYKHHFYLNKFLSPCDTNVRPLLGCPQAVAVYKKPSRITFLKQGRRKRKSDLDQ